MGLPATSSDFANNGLLAVLREFDCARIAGHLTAFDLQPGTMLP